MASTTFDTLAALRDLEAAGIESAQAEAIVAIHGHAAEPLATKADLAATAADLRADLYRALWIQGAGLVAIQIAIAGFVVALVKLL